MVFLFRFIILAAIVALIYTTIKYFFDPKRKLEKAQENKDFYFLDSSDNIHKNFLMTYKGAMFEGEKYMGTTERAFEVVSIYVDVKDPSQLYRLERNDFYYMEHEIYTHYPHSKIEWKSPIKEFLKGKKPEEKHPVD
ncbi:sigma-w pathway protein ysdB [Pseudalkalibacillus caeni]|uniref:Sigma-w pathway protein ysdB n=1 Tax=Exobacillus caeni TaxID=2574798 RepID=A0A5R9F8N9_9BACL|nr:sigma-w pathway protein ysdB [Pseudalkalibacillus caeni]TLS39411.1 sigma-w pathway protein ysdB [Pseudalkalibacillus caeni]